MIEADGSTTATYYAYDAMGVPMATYTQRETSESSTLILNDFLLYGSGRLGSYQVNEPAGGTAPMSLLAANLRFELTDHLGTVRAVVTGQKTGTGNAEIVSLTDYYPYGMDMPGRSFQSEAYRYGYQGSERDPEMSGGAGYTTYFRALDPRIGRWLTPDPKVYPWQSPYVSMDGNPVAMIDPWGASTDGPDESGGDFTFGTGDSSRGDDSMSFFGSGNLDPSAGQQIAGGASNYFFLNIEQTSGGDIFLKGFVDEAGYQQVLMDAAELVDNSNGDYQVSPGGMHYNGNTGELSMVIQNVTMKRSLIGVSGGDNVKLLGPLPGNDSGGQWLQTAGNINMWTMQAFDMAIEARMGLEKINASEALVNNRLGNGGLSGRYNVLRESAGYMRRFRTISKYGGRAFFWTGTLFSVADGIVAYIEGDNERLYMATVDIVVSSILFASGAGILAIPVYYLLKEMFRPAQFHSRPFNPVDLVKPFFHEPDNLRIDRPLFMR